MVQAFKRADDPDKSYLQGSSCAFGVFDGVHLGHEFIIESMIADAEKHSGYSVIITFDIDPDDIFSKSTHKKLMEDSQRLEALASYPVDRVLVLPFRDISKQEPEEFLNELFGLNVPASIHIGADFKFGKGAVGTVDDLRRWGEAHHMKVKSHVLMEDSGAPITSTRIRKLLQNAEIDVANKLLGHPYRLKGVVQKGRGEGAEMGFKTANLSIPQERMVLADGIYAAYALVDGVRYKAAVSVGVSPTFQDETNANVEAHILNFDGDLYGKTIVLEFMHHLRSMKKFESKEELISAVEHDIEYTRKNL